MMILNHLCSSSSDFIMNAFFKFLLIATISVLFLSNVIVAKEASIRALAITKAPTKAPVKAPTSGHTPHAPFVGHTPHNHHEY